MFCRTCGQWNEDYSTYCSNDGTLLHGNKKKINLVRGNMKFCKNCGNTINSYHLYCSNCGISTYEERKKNLNFKPEIPVSTKEAVRTNVLGKPYVKSSIVYSLIGFGIVLLISLIISGKINSALQETLAYEIGLPMNIKLINPLDLILLLNLSSLKLSFSVMAYGGASATVVGMPFIILLIPIIVFFVLGIFKGRKDSQKDSQINLINTLLIGFFYSLILAIIALFHKGNINLPIPYTGELVSMTKSYLFFATFLNGVLISTLSLLLGYGLYSKLGKKDSITNNYRYLFDGLFLFFIIGLTTAIVAGLFFKFDIAKNSYPTVGMTKNIGDKFGELVLIGQMGIYAFLMTNLGVFNMSIDHETEKLSLLKNMDFIKDSFGNNGAIFLYIVLLIPIVLFFIYGKRAKKNSNLKNIILTTLAYSVGIMILSHLTHVKIIGTGSVKLTEDFLNSNAIMGFSLISSFLGSLLLSTLSAFAGFFLGKGGVPSE